MTRPVPNLYLMKIQMHEDLFYPNSHVILFVECLNNSADKNKNLLSIQQWKQVSISDDGCSSSNNKHTQGTQQELTTFKNTLIQELLCIILCLDSCHLMSFTASRDFLCISAVVSCINIKILCQVSSGVYGK